LTTLTDRVGHALVWNAAFNICRDLLALLVMLVLVRILAPEHYGQFALVTAIIGFISVFAHQNFIAHTLQEREDEVNYQDHFTAGALIQLIMFLITNICGFALSFSTHYAAVAPLVHAMSVGFLLEWPCELRLKMLERSLAWARLRSLHAIGLVISSGVAIAMAYMGAGVYALLIPGLLTTLPFIFDLFVIEKWRPTWKWNRDRYMPALRFGFTRMASGLAARSRRLIESGVIVYVLGFSAAGLFERALSLGAMFCQRMAMQVMYTLYPFLTKIEIGTDAYRRASDIVLRGVTWLTVPLAVLLVLLATPFVHVVYGGNWDTVIPLVPAAVVLGGISGVSHVVYMLLLGNKQEQRCRNADILELSGTIIALFVLAKHGVLAYLIGLLLVRGVVFCYGAFALLSSSGIAHQAFVKAIFPALVASAVGYTCAEGLATLLSLRVHEPGAALIYAVSFVVGYVLSLRTIFRTI
jgi:O-antigen/teichoic acid export membrane protein